MKILEAFGEPISRGGQESYVISALRNMDLSDMSVDLFTPYYCDNQLHEQFITENGGTVTSCNLDFSPGSSRSNLYDALHEYLLTRRYDIVHIHSGSVSALAYSAKAAADAGVKRVIVHSHCAGVSESIKHRLIKAYSSVFFRRYATDFCACSVEAATWKFPENIVKKRTVILKNGVDTEKFRFSETARKRLRSMYSISDSTLVLGHVGRFTYEKNQLFLIRLFSRYIEKNPDSALMLVGDGEDMEKAKELVRSLGLEQNVIFTGAADNVHEIIQAFDVFVFPSLFEGLGIVGIEAQAAGLPVIASDRIPKTIKLTENVAFLGLDDSLDVWCEKISEFENNTRTDTSALIKAKGYDIRDTADELRRLYLKKQETAD